VAEVVAKPVPGGDGGVALFVLLALTAVCGMAFAAKRS